MKVSFLQQFFKTESAGGLFLLISAFLAIILANSPYSATYYAWINNKTFLINEILMSIFFLLIGLELKRKQKTEFGHLRTLFLPAAAALGGMLIPALLYSIIHFQYPETRAGWAIPVATDIAFALGALSLFGQRVPLHLKLFLMSLAIFDDIGAIIIITIFYGSHFSWPYFGLTILLMFVLFVCNRAKFSFLGLYLILGALLWYTIFQTGIHPTIAGVLLALFIPHETRERKPMLARLEKYIHPWVVFGILPLFAFCNIGFTLSVTQLTQAFTNPLITGTVVGLFLGKQLGVFGFSYILIRAKIVQLPQEVSWLALYGVSLLCGIGFTMSLFLGTLAFTAQGPLVLADVRIGVLIGSVLSGLMGVIILSFAFSKKKVRRLS